jgi:HK97 family phage portal protein
LDLQRLNPFRKKAVTAGAYPLPITGGFIPASWSWNWWQQGKAPIGNDSCVTVQACTDAYAQTVATLLPNHYAMAADGTRTPVTTSALARILHKPNSYQTRTDFMVSLIKNLLLRGNGYAVGVRNGRNEFESLHIVPSGSTVPYIDDETKAIFYAIGTNPLLGQITSLVPQRDVMHVRLYTPRHPLIGISPIEYAAASIAANTAITNHQASFFNNMSRPSGILTTPDKLTRENMLQLREAWEAQAQKLESGGIPILSSGLTWEPMALSAIDAQLVEAFNLTTTDIARAYRTPLQIIQLHNTGSTYNNVEQLYSQWLSGGLGFLIEHIEQNFSAFFGLPATEGTEFDTDSMLRTDFKGKVEGYSALVQKGVMTPNEARIRVGGLKPVDNGNECYMQQQMVPLGWTAEHPPASAAAPTEPEPEPEPEVDDEEAALASIYYLQRAVSNG